MKGAFIGGVAGATVGRGRLVAALLIFALLLCHGALGALHQASSKAVEHDAGGHHAHTAAQPVSADHGVGHHDGPIAHTDYAAVLFVVLLGAAFLLLSDRFVARSLAVSSRTSGRVPSTLALLLPRGPTLPLLQVFRL